MVLMGVGGGFLKTPYLWWEGILLLSLRTRFWDNLWSGELATSLRKLFRWCIALQGIGMHMWLNICVGTMGIAHWDALFVRPLLDWELDSVEVFSALLYSTMVVRNKEDKLVLLATRSGSFEVVLYSFIL